MKINVGSWLQCLNFFVISSYENPVSNMQYILIVMTFLFALLIKVAEKNCMGQIFFMRNSLKAKAHDIATIQLIVDYVRF
jgi:hypothetical protein